MKAPSILFFASYAAALAVRSNQPSLDPDHPGFVLKSGDEKRAICNADNLLRNFRDKRYSSSAGEFCSLYIQSTITNVFETTATEHQTVTQYSDAPTVTDVTFLVVTVTTGTETVTRQASAVNKRDDSVAYPTWLAASYPASRVSSACSCFIPAPSPAIQTSTTAVLGTETKVITQTLPPTDTTTVTVTSVSTENAVATQVVTVNPPCGLPGCPHAWLMPDASLTNIMLLMLVDIAICLATPRLLDIDVEAPPPRGMLCDQAPKERAECGTNSGPGHDDAHKLATFSQRDNVSQDGFDQQDDATATKTLDGTRGNQHGHGGGCATESASQGEQEHSSEQQIASAEHIARLGGEWQHGYLGQKIGVGNPDIEIAASKRVGYRGQSTREIVPSKADIVPVKESAVRMAQNRQGRILGTGPSSRIEGFAANGSAGYSLDGHPLVSCGLGRARKSTEPVSVSIFD
ncbi:hypothetical protein HJFPF1_10505 [Paramyrothecium foliicola]|nr:hypothetical protein HJFPF1_10505 [Paramyrothecium foliicola]